MICPFRVKGKLQYANKHIAVWKNYNFPYVGIIQIRFRQHRGGAAFWVRAMQPTLSPLYASSPFVQIYSSTVCRVLQGFCFIFCKTT